MDGKLESYLTKVAVEVLLFVETRHRDQELYQHEWRRKGKAEIDPVKTQGFLKKTWRLRDKAK